MWPNALAHLVPLEHGEAAEPVIVILLLTLGVLVALAAGVLAGARLALRAPQAARAFAAGGLLFLFYDLLKESASLGQGLLSQPLLPLGLVASFSLGFMLLALRRPGGEARVGLVWLWTLGLAAHSLGEGWTIGTEAATATLTGASGIASFLLHKGFEAFTIPLLAATTLNLRRSTGAVLVLTLATLLSAIAGWLVGPSLLPLLFFAAGAGALAHASLRLGANVVGARVAAWALGGFLFVYAAGLLHEMR